MTILMLPLAALIIFGGFVALAAMFIAGLVKKRPWISLAAVAIGLVGLVGIGIFVYALAVPAWQAARHRASSVEVFDGHSHSAMTVHVGGGVNPGERIEFHEPSGGLPLVSRHVDRGVRLSLAPILFLLVLVPAALVFVVLALVKGCRSAGPRGSRSSRGGGFPTWAQLAVIALAVVGMLGFVSVREVKHVAHHSSEFARRQMEEARRHAAEAGRQAEDAMRSGARAAAIDDPNVSIEALEEKFIGPKIPLPPAAPTAPVAEVAPPSETPEAGAGEAPAGDGSADADANQAETNLGDVPDGGDGASDGTARDDSAGEETQSAETVSEETDREDTAEESSEAKNEDETQALEASQGEAEAAESSDHADVEAEHAADVSAEAADTDEVAPAEPATDGGETETAVTSGTEVAMEEAPPAAETPAPADEAKSESSGLGEPASAVAIVAPADEAAPSSTSTITRTASEATSAVKAMASSMTEFARAIDRAVDAYADAKTSSAALSPEQSVAERLSTTAKLVAATSGAGASEVGTSEAPSAESPRRERPRWTEERPKRIGDTEYKVIATDEYATERECQQAADILLLLATYEHLNSLVGHGFPTYTTQPAIEFRSGQIYADDEAVVLSNGHLWDPRLRQLQSMGVTPDFIRREIVAHGDDGVQRSHLETVSRSFGDMHKLFVQARFTPSADDQLRRMWNGYRRGERMAVVGAGGVGILALLGLVWGALKFDTMTKGYYTKRIFLGIPLGVLTMFGLYVLLVEMGFDLPH